MTPERLAEINALAKGDPMVIGRELVKVVNDYEAEIERLTHDLDDTRATGTPAGVNADAGRIVHYTLGGTRAVCGHLGQTPHWLAYDPDDDEINCDRCRIWLAGYRAGKETR